MQRDRHFRWWPFFHPSQRRHPSAPAVEFHIAEIRRLLMDPSADAQDIIAELNKIPAAVSASIASQVQAAEAAKDAQRQADITAIKAAADAALASVPQAA